MKMRQAFKCVCGTEFECATTEERADHAKCVEAWRTLMVAKARAALSGERALVIKTKRLGK